jgi:hypothetical protein
MTTIHLGGFTLEVRVWGVILLTLMLGLGFLASALFWFGVWPLKNVDIFVAFSQILIAAIAIYAIVNKLD